MVQRGADDSALQFPVKGYTKLMAHHKRKEDRTWWFAVLSNVQGDCHRDRGDSFFFDSTLHERDGLMSYRSSRAQQDGLCAIRRNGIGKIFGQCPLKAFRIHLITDERKQVGRKFTDYALRR